MLGVGSFFGGSGRYRVGERIGRGGFGTVHRGWTHAPGGFKKPVAIKMVHGDAKELEGRLRDEARLLGLIHHRAIVTVDDLVVIDGRWCLVMEYVDGCDLSALIARGPLPPRVAFEIAAEVGGALAAARTVVDTATNVPLDLIHRDIKPANLRVTPHGDVKVLDFGVARAAFEGRESHTGTIAFGSPGYLAPERLDGVDSPAADVFALGVVLAECLLGRALGPLSVDRRRHDAALAALVEELPVGGDLVGAALAYDREARPSAAELATRLRAAAATMDGPWLAEWAPVAVADALDRPVVAPLLSTMTVAGRGARPRAALVAAGAVALLGAVALGAWLLVGGPAGADAPAAGPAPPEPVATAPLLVTAPPATTDPGPPATPEAPAAGAAVAGVQAPRHHATPSPPHARAAPHPAPAEPAVAPPPTSTEPAVAAPATSTDAAPPPDVAPPTLAPTEPVAPAPTGTVRVEGDADVVRLIAEGGRVFPPGVVPAGRVSVEARFGDALVRLPAPVEVPPGGTLRLRCNAAVQNCRVTE